jgi:hypothetical protein
VEKSWIPAGHMGEMASADIILVEKLKEKMYYLENLHIDTKTEVKLILKI